ncbi:sensor histidine kinase [Natronoflexus pectinivorans]|uniref:histidine kinase n=1 Tax=Natronoflexus pectinivorans TaxID=682526 RepID=A0A4R2GHX7_9BACT|nr:HAMP domain-containing sensor histidine kinase [Natronoflexus pectinivorans]TCO08048.1 histidine kinase/DNA gyrase B/HSP90-like ATPase [Natronoflexus pectinivorans]
MNAQFKVKRINVHIEITNPIYVYADKDMVNSIIRNLLSNAKKISMPNGKINISAKKRGKMIEISIEDNGVGMDEKIAESMFSPKGIISQQGSQGEKGSGLGLILCKEFVDYHKGEIWVKSSIGKGAKFYFTLPIF